MQEGVGPAEPIWDRPAGCRAWLGLPAVRGGSVTGAVSKLTVTTRHLPCRMPIESDLDQSRASEYFPRLTWPATHPVCFIKRRHLAPNTAKPWGQAGGRSPGILERSVPRVFIITAPECLSHRLTGFCERPFRMKTGACGPGCDCPRGSSGSAWAIPRGRSSRLNFPHEFMTGKVEKYR